MRTLSEGLPVASRAASHSHELSIGWTLCELASFLACRLLSVPASACKQTTERDKMESMISESSYAIHYENETFHAAVCSRCGAKMFPAELLEAHMDRHELKDMYLQSELKKLQYSMNRMR
jgi:ribosomal protein S27AE